MTATSIRATIKKLNYSDTWMGERFVTATFTSPTPIDFQIGDYISYRGEDFVINYDPSVIKKAKRGAYGEAFEYNDVKFYAVDYELQLVGFEDYVQSTNGSGANVLHFSPLTDFGFYASTVRDLGDRLQANLDRVYIGERKWTVIVDDSIQTEPMSSDAYGTGEGYVQGEDAAGNGIVRDKYVLIQNTNCWNALILVNNLFKTTFWIKGRTIHIGSNPPFSASLEYGKNKGLLEINKIAKTDSPVYTRFKIYGSSKNVSNRYYYDLQSKPFANKISSDGSNVVVDIIWSEKYYTTKLAGREEYEVFASATNGGTAKKAFVTSKVENNILYTNVYFATGVPEGFTDKIWFTDGVNREQFDKEHVVYPSNGIPSALAVTKLMLPGFPLVSLHDWALNNEPADAENHKAGWKVCTVDDDTAMGLDLTSNNYLKYVIYDSEGLEVVKYYAYLSEDQYTPFIDSPNRLKYGVREVSVNFDGSTDEFSEIYPTITGMKDGEGNPMNSIYTGDTITDNGVFKEGDTINPFTITINDVGFNLLTVLENNSQITMASGLCSSRSFNIKNAVCLENNKWELTLEREKDGELGVYFPYEYGNHTGAYHISSSDKYVLVNVKMSDAIVENSAKRLLYAGLDYADNHDFPKFNYSLKVDNEFISRERDFLMTGNVEVENEDGTIRASNITDSIYWNIIAGSKISVPDEDLGISDETRYISSLQIHEGNSLVPEFEITLKETKDVGIIQQVEGRVDNIVNGVVNGTGSMGTTISGSIRNYIATYGKDLFLSKVKNDTSKGRIAFWKGIQLGSSYVAGLTGHGGLIDGEGNGELRSLKVWESLEVPELIYNRVNVNAGVQWDTNGGGIIEDVLTDVDNKKIIKLKLEDGELGAVAVGDFCMGIWHDVSGNAVAHYDDNRGIFNFRGFKTIYFKVKAIAQSYTINEEVEIVGADGATITEVRPITHNNSNQQYFEYEVRTVAQGGNGFEPFVGMHFAQRGNATNTSRQGFSYRCTSYGMTLQGVNSWTWADANISMIWGHIDGMTYNGETLQSSGMMLGNLYYYGSLKHIKGVTDRLVVSRSKNGMLEQGESETITVNVVDAFNVDLKDSYYIEIVKRVPGRGDLEYRDMFPNDSHEFTFTKSIENEEVLVIRAIESTFDDEYWEHGDKNHTQHPVVDGKTFSYSITEKKLIYDTAYDIKVSPSSISVEDNVLDTNEIIVQVVKTFKGEQSVVSSLPSTLALQYSRDNSNWQNLAINATTKIATISLLAADVATKNIYIRLYRSSDTTAIDTVSIPIIHNGLSGCVYRTTEWQQGTIYKNDEESGYRDAQGIGYVDVVVTKDAVGIVNGRYKCIKSFPDGGTGSQTAPSLDTTHFQALDSTAPIFAPLVMAENGVFNVAQSGQILITDQNGNVAAGLVNGSYPLWVGATTATAAPFYVGRDGSLKATNADIEGNIKAFSGSFGGYNIEKPVDGRLVRVWEDGFTLDSHGLNCVIPDDGYHSGNEYGAVYIYNEVYKRLASIGTTTTTSYSGMTAVANFRNEYIPPFSSSTAHVCIIASAKGSSHAAGGLNAAIYAEHGVYAGFRMYIRRVENSVTLNTLDNYVEWRGNANGKTITLPPNAEDGQVIYVRKNSAYNVNISVASGSGQRIRIWDGDYSETNSFSLEYRSLVMLVYDEVYKFWLANIMDNR